MIMFMFGTFAEEDHPYLQLYSIYVMVGFLRLYNEFSFWEYTLICTPHKIQARPQS